jgi:hypothetical protein
MSCCDDWGQCTQGPNCPARAHLFTRNGGQQVDTSRPCTRRPNSGELPIVDLSGDAGQDIEAVDRAAWTCLLRETFILMVGIAIGAMVCIAAIAAGIKFGA